MTPDELLITWTHARAVDAASLGALTPAESDELARLIRIHRVGPWLSAGSGGRAGGGGFEALLLRLRLDAMALEARSRKMRREAMGALCEAGLEPVVLKGAVLGSLLYAHPALRPGHDLDVLIPPGGLDRARAVLAGLGYARQRRNGLLAGAFSHEEAWRRDDTVVELHRHVTQKPRFHLRVEDLLARAVSWEDQGLALRRLDDTDQLLTLAIHAAHHQFLIPLLHWNDMRLLVRQGIDLDALARRAGEARCKVTLRAVARVLDRWFDEPGLLAATQKLAPGRESRLARFARPVLPRAARRSWWRDRQTAFSLIDRRWDAIRFAAGYVGRSAVDAALSFALPDLAGGAARSGKSPHSEIDACRPVIHDGGRGRPARAEA